MQLVSLEKTRSTQLFYLVAGLLAAVFLLTAKQDDPGVVAAGITVAIASIYPLYFWLLGWSHGLPIWPVFVASNGILAALPMIQDSENLTAYTPGEIIIGGFTFVGFFALGTVVWLSLTGRQRKPPEVVLMISREHSERYLFVFVILGLLFYLNQLAWIIPFPGNTMQIARGITGALSTLGIFVLAFYDGQGMLKRSQSIALAVLASLTALAGAAGLIMATAIVPVAMLLMGYALGSGKLPWKSLVVVLLVAAILHPGKFAMRDLYWGPDRPTFRLTMLPQFYADWFGYGIDQVATMTGVSQKLAQEEVKSSLFERSGVLHMLLLVQRKSPDEVPFLNGLTYEPIPRLLIPRFIDSDKGISHAGNVLLTVNYGVQTLEQTQTTSIGWGLVPEAYANFGYVGVAALAVALAMFYSWMTNISVGAPMTSLRFVLGLLIMAAATKADTMGVFITSQFQGVVGVSLAALVLMKRQRNPFAADAANGGLQDYGTTRGSSLGLRLKSEETKGPRDDSRQVGPAKWGGHKPPRWAPLSHRRAFELAAARRKAEAASLAGEESKNVEQKTERPRQVAVPIQPYYYRSRKA